MPHKLKSPDRTHPEHELWVSDEKKQRASYLATKRHLVPFLVPHRYEGEDISDPAELTRAKYGFGIGLNKPYVGELKGHIADAEVTRNFGPLDATGDETVAAPEGGVMERIWEDATRDGTTWTNFFNDIILEWALTSLGGFVLVDTPDVEVTTESDAQEADARPFVRWVPWSSVEDVGLGDQGYRWIKLREVRDEREPDSEENELTEYHVLYTVQEDGSTLFQRFDEDGKEVTNTPLGEIVDQHGRARLPLVQVGVGQHPDVKFLRSGVLMGPDDIVIDLYNIVNETRAAYRDATFSVDVYKGDEATKVQRYRSEGSRFVPLGENPDSELTKMAADGTEVTVGLELIKLSLSAWALAVKRKAAEAVESKEARSGDSITAEFQLDVKPLLVTVSDHMDEVESQTLHIIAQMDGETPERANDITVERNKDFRLEDEATRISKIVQEFTRSLQIPGTLKSEIVKRWADSLDFIDLSQTVGEGEGENAVTLRDVVSDEADELGDAAQRESRTRLEVGELEASLRRGE